jgi:hypothetical protein
MHVAAVGSRESACSGVCDVWSKRMKEGVRDTAEDRRGRQEQGLLFISTSQHCKAQEERQIN